MALERHKRLKSDPAKLRAFVQRGRDSSSLERGELKRRRPKRSPAKRGVAVVEGPLSPAEWKRRVFVTSGGQCVVSRSRAYDVDDPRFHAHHPVSQSSLRQRGLQGWLWDERNGMLVTRTIHMAHEHTGGKSRIRREFVPVSVWEFCAELDALAGTSWATEHVNRRHPAS